MVDSPPPLGSRPDALYRAYLVRMWQAGPEGPWRASAESTATRRVYHFVHLEELFAFLAEGMTASGADEG